METINAENINILKILTDLGTIGILLAILKMLWSDLQTRRRDYEAKIDKKDEIIHTMLRDSIETTKDIKEALRNNTEAMKNNQTMTERVYELLKNSN